MIDIEQALYVDDVRALAAGKITSTMLELVLEMQLFPKIHGKEVTLEELAGILEMPVWSTRVLAQFLCREGLLVYEDRKLSSAPRADAFLVKENRELYDLRTILDFNLPKEHLKQLLLNPPEEHGYQQMGKEKHFLGVHSRRVMWGEQLAKMYSFKGHRVFLDVAGASGGVPIGVRKHNPHLKCILFDLPDSAEFAAQCIAEAREEESIRFVGGSFLTDDLPKGADVALLSNIIHNWPPEEDKLILQKIYDALEPGGALIVKEAFFEDDWTGHMEPVFQAFFMGKDGWQPTYGEVEEMMEEVGFVDLERRFDIFGLVIGRKPV
jgi:3-hydroxy-5-methyl-1-naphthoate 3-O-methyltransferase